MLLIFQIGLYSIFTSLIFDTVEILQILDLIFHTIIIMLTLGTLYTLGSLSALHA